MKSFQGHAAICTNVPLLKWRPKIVPLMKKKQRPKEIEQAQLRRNDEIEDDDSLGVEFGAEFSMTKRDTSISTVDTGHKALCPVSRPRNPGILCGSTRAYYVAVAGHTRH